MDPEQIATLEATVESLKIQIGNLNDALSELYCHVARAGLIDNR